MNAYLTLLLNFFKSNPKMLTTLLRMLADYIDANPVVLNDIISHIPK